MRKETRGFGMTVEEVLLFETSDELKQHFRDAAEFWRARGNSFEVQIAGIEEWAGRQLASVGGIEVLRERPLTDSLADRAGDHAAKILKYISIVRKAIADNNAQEAARFAIEIGMLFDRIQSTIEWESLALRGKAIADAKRGLSRLYREAHSVLEKRGSNLPAKLVRRELELAKVTRERGEVLYWNDDRGVKKSTTAKQFASRLGSVRKLLR